MAQRVEEGLISVYFFYKSRKTGEDSKKQSLILIRFSALKESKTDSLEKEKLFVSPTFHEFCCFINFASRLNCFSHEIQFKIRSALEAKLRL